jgi:hypothetical protein
MLDLRSLRQCESVLHIDPEIADGFSILSWPSRICTARRFPVALLDDRRLVRALQPDAAARRCPAPRDGAYLTAFYVEGASITLDRVLATGR